MDVAPVGFNWTGGYIGGQVGYGWGDVYQTSDPAPGDYAHPDPDGWLGGVYAGYNYQFANNVVLGADADFAWTGADGSDLFYNSGVPAPDQYRSTFDVEWSGAVRARLGYAVDRWLPFAAAGVAFSKAEWNATDNGVPYRSFDDTYVGWTIGVGTEYAFTDNLIGRIEYRYSDFGSAAFENVDVDFKSSDVRLGVAYKF